MVEHIDRSSLKRVRPREESPEIEVIQEPQPKRAKLEKLVNGDRELSSGRQSPSKEKLVQNLGIDSRAQEQEAGEHSRPSMATSELTIASSEVTSADPSRGPTPQAVETVEDLLAKLPPIDPSAVLEEWRQHEAEEEVDGLIPLMRPKTELTQQLIKDLNNGQLEHIGGIRDHEGEFKEWHQMTSLVSKDGEQLHILPYSVID